MLQISISVLLIFFTESETFKVKNKYNLANININKNIHFKYAKI